MNINGPDQMQEHNLKLLVVDDEEIIRVRLKELGEKLGFSVAIASDGVEGWELFKAHQPQLAVLDIYMPRMNGLLLMRKIKEADPNCPVILVTGFLHYEQLIQRDQVKPDGFIIKPFHLEKIANLMLELVERRTEASVID
ncbi:MAG: response regulator [bacterium]|nr:response regulator [bacterium]